MRSEHNQIGLTFRSDIQDPGSHFRLDHSRLDLESFRTQFHRCTADQDLGLAQVLAQDFGELGCISPSHLRRSRVHKGLHYVQDQHLCSFGTELRGQGASGCFRKARIVDRQNDFHRISPEAADAL
jgi:hypothetical protein